MGHKTKVEELEEKLGAATATANGSQADAKTIADLKKKLDDVRAASQAQQADGKKFQDWIWLADTAEIKSQKLPELVTITADNFVSADDRLEVKEDIILNDKRQHVALKQGDLIIGFKSLSNTTTRGYQAVKITPGESLEEWLPKLQAKDLLAIKVVHTDLPDSERFGITCDFPQLHNITFHTKFGYENWLKTWTGWNHVKNNQALYQMHIRDHMYGTNFQLKKFRINGTDENGNVHVPTPTPGTETGWKQELADATKACEGVENTSKRVTLFFQGKSSEYTAGVQKVTKKTDTCTSGYYTISPDSELWVNFEKVEFDGRFITVVPKCLEDYGVKPGDILKSFASNKTYTVEKKNVDWLRQLHLDARNQTMKNDSYMSHLNKLVFYRPAVVTAKKSLGEITCFWDNNGYNRRKMRKTKELKDKGAAAKCLLDAGISDQNYLMKFQLGAKDAEFTSTGDGKWIKTFNQYKNGIVEDDQSTYLTMWFISETDITAVGLGLPALPVPVPVPVENGNGRRRLTALSDRFRRLREFQASTSM